MPEHTASIRVSLLVAAAVTAGATAVVEFLLPLWAGDRLHASSAIIGGMVATQIFVALAARPIVARLTDRGGRAVPVTTGALLIAAAMALYATASSYAPVFAGAALAGVGSALFWIPVQSVIADLDGSANAYGRLFAFQTRGSLAGFIAAFTLLARTGYRTVFLCAAGVVLLAAVLIWWTRMPSAARPRSTPVSTLNRRLLPVAALVAVTALAQSGLALILLLHLQRHFHLVPGQIGLVLGPGAVTLAVVGGRSHRLADRIGRGAVLTAATASIGVMAAVLAFAGNTGIIMVAWALAAASIAASVPVEQAAVAAASRDGSGHGFGLYGSAGLVGAFLGPAVFGALYGSIGWMWTCLVVAVLVASALPLVPWVMRAASGADAEGLPVAL